MALLAFSVWQSTQKKDKQQAAYDQAAREQTETEAVMRKIGEEAARGKAQGAADEERAYRSSAAAMELKKLDEADEAEWRAKHHLPIPPATSSSAAR